MKDDVISRKAAIDAILNICNECNSGYCGPCMVNYPGERDCKKALEELPSAEPEIIRCKDCKHQEKFFHTDGRRKGGGYYIYGCDFAEGYSHVCLDDDFCSRAERRQDDNNK